MANIQIADALVSVTTSPDGRSDLLEIRSRPLLQVTAIEGEFKWAAAAIDFAAIEPSHAEKNPSTGPGMAGAQSSGNSAASLSNAQKAFGFPGRLR